MDSEKFEPVGEQKTKQSSKIILIAIIVVLLILVPTIVVFARNSSAEAIFKKQIDKLFMTEKVEKYDTIKADVDLEMKVEGEDEDSIKQVADLLNDIKISFHVEKDQETQDQIFGVTLAKAQDKLVDAKAKMEGETQKTYVDLGEFFDKTIEMDTSEILEDELDNEASEGLDFVQMLYGKKAMAIAKKEIKDQFKKEYFETEKTTIDNEKVTKNVCKLTGKDFKDIIENVCTNLAKNEEFLDCFEDRIQVKESLEELKQEAQNSELSDDVQFEFDLYTKGFLNQIKRLDATIEEEGETFSVQITKVSDEEYAYALIDDNGDEIQGSVKIHKTDSKTEVISVAEVEGVKVTAKVAVDMVYNEELSEFKKNNVVKSEELTSTDIMTLYGNFMNSKLYEFVESIYSDTALLPSGTESDLDSQDDETSNLNITSKDNLPNNKVKTYDNQEVEFSISDGFENYSSESERYKLFQKRNEKGKIDVKVAANYSSLSEYIERIQNKTQFYEEGDRYKNVQVSDVEQVNVNGNQFSKIIFSYEYELWDGQAEKYEDTYLACELDNENLYTVEIENSNNANPNEWEAFLKIKK